jgi:hypothetical protein
MTFMTDRLVALTPFLKRKESPYLRFLLRAFREADPCFGDEEDPDATEHS